MEAIQTHNNTLINSIAFLAVIEINWHDQCLEAEAVESFSLKFQSLYLPHLDNSK